MLAFLRPRRMTWVLLLALVVAVPAGAAAQVPSTAGDALTLDHYL
jgi:hypothetical protein